MAASASVGQANISPAFGPQCGVTQSTIPYLTAVDGTSYTLTYRWAGNSGAVNCSTQTYTFVQVDCVLPDPLAMKDTIDAQTAALVSAVGGSSGGSGTSGSTSLDLAALGIDAPTIGYVWAWGFAVMLVGWGVGYGVSLAVGLIKKL